MDLDTSVALLEQNYQQLEKRLEKVEHKLDEMRDDMKSGQIALIKVIIGTTGTVIVGLISVVGVIITNS
jgi:hypothetical protein